MYTRSEVAEQQQPAVVLRTGDIGTSSLWMDTTEGGRSGGGVYTRTNSLT